MKCLERPGSRKARSARRSPGDHPAQSSQEIGGARPVLALVAEGGNKLTAFWAMDIETTGTLVPREGYHAGKVPAPYATARRARRQVGNCGIPLPAPQSSLLFNNHALWSWRLTLLALRQR